MEKLMRRSLFMAFFLLLSGCLMVPKYDLPNAFDSAECNLSAEEEGDLAFGDWPKKGWWEEFQDPTLTFLIETAIQDSPDLKSTKAKWNLAMQLELQKRAALFPEIDFDANTNYEHFSKYGMFRGLFPTFPAVLDDTTLGLSFNYEVDFWGRNRDLFEAAVGRAAAVEAEIKQSELMLSTAIAYTYSDLQFFLRKKEILEQIEGAKKELLCMRENRVDFGIDPSLEPLAAKSILLDTAAELKKTEKEISLRLHQLKLLAGLTQDQELSISHHPLHVLSVNLPENLSVGLLAQRPDLAAQKYRMVAAAKEIGAARSNFYPKFNLMAFLGLESIHWQDLFRLSSFDGSLFPAVSLPIFTAGRLKAELMEKVAAFDEAVQSYNQLILQAAKEVLDHLSTISALSQEIEVRNASYETASKLASIRERRLEKAIDSKLLYLESKVFAFEKELLLADLLYARQLAKILLIRSLGGGWNES